MLPCSGKAPGRVIGRGGATVNRIQDSTGASIDIRREDETCVISGSASAVTAAVAEVRLIIAEGDDMDAAVGRSRDAGQRGYDDDNAGDWTEVH